jgi:probable phosphomutase (TIGR03848 family)
VTTLLLLRHGRTAANASGVLAGWTPGVDLDDTGRVQAAAAGERLKPLQFAAVVSSPLERCLQTVAAALDVEPHVDERLGECHYGDWTGRPLKELAREPLWKVVQQHPSAAVFPGPDGEALAGTQARAVAAVREWNVRVADTAGPDAVWLACSHGDVIKAIVADALGLHLDLFQRIVADPCSITAIRYTPTRPFVLNLNDTGGDLSALAPAPKRRRRAQSSDAAVGGGSGTG